MSLKTLYEGVEVRASLTMAGINPERGFRFAKPLPPFSGKENIHISKAVIKQSSLAIEDLKKDTILKISVTNSKNRNGDLSWTALAIDKSHITSTITHIGVIDSGGIQYLSNDRIAWFLEDVFPELPADMTKCIVFENSLSKKAKNQRDIMVPGTLMMFYLDRNRVSKAEVFLPETIETDFLMTLLRKCSQLKNTTLVETITTVCKRKVELPADFALGGSHEDVLDEVIQDLRGDSVLKELASTFSEPMIDSVFRSLPVEESLAIFPNHPKAWNYPDTSYYLCNQMIRGGIDLEKLIHHLEDKDVPSNVWSLVGENHQNWVLANIASTEKFQDITTLLDDQCLEMLMMNIDVEDILSVKHLIPWLSSYQVSSGLNRLVEGDFEPDETLTGLISKRLHSSNNTLSNAALVWFPEMWPRSDFNKMIAIIEQQKQKLIQNSRHKRLLGLIAHAIGNVIVQNNELFNDPDFWENKPSTKVSFLIDIVQEFPLIEEELEAMSAFNMWDEPVRFEGPSRIWLSRDSLGKAWPYFTTNEKLLALHYLLSNNVAIPEEINASTEKHQIIKAYLKLIYGALNNAKEQASIDAHNHIIEGVLKKIPATGAKVAISQAELHIDFDRAIPRCGIPESSGVRFCEGNHRTKPSLSDYRNKIPAENITPDMRHEYECHCPRLERKKGGYRYSGCLVATGDGEGFAKLFESKQLPWTQWTILEVLAILDYPPNLISYFKAHGRKPRLQNATINHNEYANKVAAVVNRIDDLRDRLRCGWRNGHIDPHAGCGAPLNPDFSFRVFPAAYGITVTGGCQEHSSGPHDIATYFNHCKRCVTIIDSRESPIKDDSNLNTYVCSSCGGWGQEASGEFKKCGKCGSYDSYKHEGNKSMRCQSCSHTWNPPNKYWAKI